MKTIPTYYFSEDELQPDLKSSKSVLGLLSEDTLKKLENIANRLQTSEDIEINIDEITDSPDIAMYIGFLKFFGAVIVTQNHKNLQLKIAGPMAKDLPLILVIMLKHGFSIFNDWGRRYKILPDQLSAIEFLFHIEPESCVNRLLEFNS